MTLSVLWKKVFGGCPGGSTNIVGFSGVFVGLGSWFLGFSWVV